jgi:acetyl-CoA synthetase
MDMIKKTKSGWKVPPNLVDYQATRSSFTWEAASRWLDGLPGAKGLNIAYETIDRHANGNRRDQIAIRCLTAENQVKDYTYGDMLRLTNRFANLLQKLGIGAGDSVFTLIGRVPELYISALGTLKNQSVYCPLFSAFGPQPVKSRLALGKAKVLITTAKLYLRKVKQLRQDLPDLEHVLIVNPQGQTNAIPQTHDFHSLLEASDEPFTIAPTDPETPALLHFTSGTTGNPKGAIHVHAAIIAHYASAKFALDLHPDDIFWCTADPGWVTGTSYGIIAPLALGATLIVDQQDFEAQRWWRILQAHSVSVWYTSPTAIRMMMRFDKEGVKNYDISTLRFVASVGEPLNAEAVVWGNKAFKQPVHDTWWQTETGAIMIANFIATDIKPGSMGKPLPGVEAAIVRSNEGGRMETLTPPNVTGELALRPGWPSMFRGYLNDEARYRRCFQDGWYLSGDLARCDTEGYYWFVGRADDMIKSAGHFIGPIEVERILSAHPAVADVAVVGKPDALIHQFVKGYIVLKPGYPENEALKRELLAQARKRLGATLAPREIEFREALPRNPSGKVMRRLL